MLSDNGYVDSSYPIHDIALLKLEHPLMINNHTRPICLPSMTSLDDVLHRGTSAECYVIGLGVTENFFSGKICFINSKNKQFQIALIELLMIHVFTVYCWYFEIIYTHVCIEVKYWFFSNTATSICLFLLCLLTVYSFYYLSLYTDNGR